MLRNIPIYSHIDLWRKIFEYNLKNLLGITPVMFQLKDYCIEAVFNRGKLLGQRIKFPFEEGYSPFSFWKELLGYFQMTIPQKGGYVIHGGAYRGELAIITSGLVGFNGRIFAYEPNEYNRNYLEKVIKVNDVKNVKILSEGLSNKIGTEKFYLSGSISMLNGICKNGAEKNNSVCISTTTIDHLVEQEGLLENKFIPIYIFMDIEGAEILAMEGAKRTLERGNVFFAIASYHIIDGKRTSEILIEKYSEDFLVIPTYERHLTTYILPKQVKRESSF